MAKMEQLELDAHRAKLAHDVEALVEKYCAIFGWDVPEINEGDADRLIFEAVRQKLNHMEKALPGASLP